MPRSSPDWSASMSFLPPDNDRIAPRPSRCARLATATLFLVGFFGAAVSICQTQTQIGGVLCRGGDGNFDAEFRTGIKVHVGAARNEFSTHTCAAKLSWEKQELVVATGVAQLDLDAFGVDLGDGLPVAAFQIKKSDTDCCMDYGIYSLEKPPRLLRTITGGDFFSARDGDLDGSVEIWTHDAAAANGFEKLTLGELDFAPTVIFRFAHGRLLDASAEFQSYFDKELARIKAGVSAHDLEDFKNSDGSLAEMPTPTTADRLHHLRVVKIRVLEIVWAYLYSGREQDAWRALGEMWPPADVDRIRAALLNARAHGIGGQADGTSADHPEGKKKRLHIFEAAGGPGRRLEVNPPRAILLELPTASVIQQFGSQPQLLLDLVIDAAGKVRAVEPTEKASVVDRDRIKMAMTWKFIPAFKDGRAVASHMRIAVSPKQ